MSFDDLRHLYQLLLIFRYGYLDDKDWIVPDLDKLIKLVNNYMEDY